MAPSAAAWPGEACGVAASGSPETERATIISRCDRGTALVGVLTLSAGPRSTIEGSFFYLHMQSGNGSNFWTLRARRKAP